jgi:glycosyltransferase involved in cell wall biosynthesis
MSALDGLNILRYGHVYESGGGVEQYLADLNRTLLARNHCNFIQVQLTSDTARVGEAEEGRFRRVSLFVDQGSHERAIAGTDDESSPIFQLKTWLRDKLLFQPWVYRHATGPILARYRIPRRDGEPDDPGQIIRALHQHSPLDLICLHYAGGADIDGILAVAQSEGIPTVYIHHFSNDRLSASSIRKQVGQMDGVAGVCGVDVPSYLHRDFQNVSDGIDTAFFQRDRAKPTYRTFDRPIIFLPARITAAKGQAELIRAAGELKRRGLNFHVILAGRTDSAAFLAELQNLIQQESVEDRVEFVGQLDPTQLRDRYAAAALVAFPTRHHEGLPRILLECQAMEVPPLVYNIGGTAEGVKDGQTGFVLTLGDLAGLVTRLGELLQDQKLRLKMGHAGRRLVEERFSLNALAERHEQFYLKAIVTAGRSRTPMAR